MARQGINTGSSPDAGDGDALLTGAIKINANFSEIYSALGDGTNITNSIGFAVTAGISTYATRAGIATYATTAGIATYSNSSRVVIKDSGSTVGTAGTIDFGDNLTVSAISAGVVTVTAASGTSSQWVSTAAGIHTLSSVGIGTTNPTSALTVVGSGTSTSQLYVTGVATFRGSNNSNVHLGSPGYAGVTWSGIGGVYTGNEPSILTNSGLGLEISGGLGDLTLSAPTSGGDIILNAGNLNPTAISCIGNAQVELNYNGSKKFETLGAGVTVTGTTFTDQLSVSGVSTFGNPSVSTDNLKIDNVGNATLQAGRLITFSGNTNVGIRWTSALGYEIHNGSNLGSDDRKITIQSLYEGDIVLKGQYANRAVFTNNGATVTGTTFTDQLSVSGVSTFIGSVGIGTTNPVSGYNLTIGVSNTGIRTTSLKVYGYADINGLTVKGNSRDYTDNVIITQNPSTTFYGNRNVAIGDQSFTTPGAAGENVAIGYYALNAVGNSDGLNTWNGNTAVGAWAGQSATTTLRNTFIGYNSGKYITTGGENTILGSYDGNQNGLDIRTSSNNVVLSDGAGNIRLYANSSGNIGIGTTNPTVKLEVNGSARVGVDTSAGVILTSPNGTKYQLFVEDDGTLKTVAV